MAPSQSIMGSASRAGLRALAPVGADRHESLARLCKAMVDQGVALDLSVRSWGDRTEVPSVVVALPAASEEEALGATLWHLAAAFGATARACGLVVFANNCNDLTAELVAHAAPGLSARVVLLEGRLSDMYAHAGWARRIALEAAALVCRDDGAILTTDADTHVPRDWVETLSTALDDDFDLVCGRILADEQPDLLAHAPAIRLVLAESAYAALQDRVRHCCDQLIGRQPLGGAQPHYVEAGASLGITRALYRRIGGLPPVPSSEDRALVRAAERADARILYTTRSRVETSNRLVGRARGGLAETLRRRMHAADPVADQRLRPLEGIARMWSNALAVLRPQTDCMQPVAPAIRHALLENEWLRSITEPRMRAADLEREMAGLAAFLRQEVEPMLLTWRAAA